MGWSSSDQARLVYSRLVSALLFFAAAGRLAAGEQAPCGCSWSYDYHCGISSKQLVKAVTGTRVSKICNVVSKDGTVKLKPDLSKTCGIHKRIQSRIKPFRDCLDMETKDQCAARSAECQWEAQADKKCGIDPEKLVMRLVNVSHAEKRHHFVKWVSESDKCNSFARPECTIDKGCQWLSAKDVENAGMTFRKHCDVALSEVLHDLLNNAHAYQMIHIYMESATCLAHLENSPNFTQEECPTACWKGPHGECVLPRHADPTSWPVMELQDAICGHSKKCEAPCKKEGEKCVGPTGDISSYVTRMSEQESEIIDVMMVLSAAAAPYELRCQAIKDQSECEKASDPDVCEGFLGIHEGDVAPTFGLSGRVASLIRKTFDGSLTKEVNAFLDEHPEVAEEEANEMSKKFVDKISEYIPWGPDPVATTTTKQPAAEDKGKKQSGGGVGVLSMSLFVLALLLCGAVVCSGLTSSKPAGRNGVEMKLDPAREYQRAPGA